jgi:hypothetical protein
MVDMLLSIVEEKTGYPRDMVGLDQNLESDLGIDSIKRIEVVGAMLQKLPEGLRAADREPQQAQHPAHAERHAGHHGFGQERERCRQPF